MGFAVADYARSKAFYERALAPLGFVLLTEPMGEAAGFGRDGKASFLIEARGRPVQGSLHVAFAAKSRNLVDAFHAAAIAAGGNDNGAPGVREVYHPNYYGAYVLDPDGNNVEAVCHEPVN
jgi:catechol 2,3-dioxygenase-like lactoylglutathione lyase family enzyme